MQYHGLISSRVAIGDNKGAYKIFKIAISIFGIIGFMGTSILFCYAKRIADTYLGIPEAEMTIIALSPSIFIVSITSVLRGYFNGREKISVTANSQTIEQILKTALTILMVEFISRISNQNTVVMVAGAAITATIASSFSLIYLYIFYINNKKEIWKDVITSTTQPKESVGKDIIRNILYITIPIAITSLISAANKTIDAFTVVNIMSEFMEAEDAKLQYGILTGKVEGLVVLPYSFNIAFAITLIPAIAASQATGEMEKAKKRIKFSILATILISLPCTAVLFVFAEPILKLLFPNAYLGKTMLKLCSLSIVFVAITQTIGGILQGLKRVKEPAIAAGIGALVKLVLNLILVPIKELNINGAIISTIISHIVIFIISFYYLQKNLKIHFNIVKFVIKPLLGTAFMIISAYVFYNYFKNSMFQNSNLIFALIIGTFVYGMSIICLKILSPEEFNMLPYGNKILKKRSESLNRRNRLQTKVKYGRIFCDKKSYAFRRSVAYQNKIDLSRSFRRRRRLRRKNASARRSFNRISDFEKLARTTFTRRFFG